MLRFRHHFNLSTIELLKFSWAKKKNSQSLQNIRSKSGSHVMKRRWAMLLKLGSITMSFIIYNKQLVQP